jgi:ATP-dependent DNA helicase DinG
MTESAYSWLGPNGRFAQIWERYEARSGQLAMAEAVERALDAERVLFCEAGTGTGKTFAYLVPALLTGRRIVISTATRALQDQIWNSDLPLLEKALGRPISATLMKGLSNYLCLRRAELAYNEATLSTRSALRAIEEWQHNTETGDFAELTNVSERDPALALVQSSSDTRLGSRCPYFDRCFVTRMRRQAEASQLLIVNHHLFFADLALKGAHPGLVIPDYDAVILDEAHQVEDTAALFFGTRVSQRQLTNLVKDATMLLQQAQAKSNLPSQVEKSALALFSKVCEGTATDTRTRLSEDVWIGQTHRAYLDLDEMLDSLTHATNAAKPGVEDQRETWEGLDAITRRSQDLRNSLAFVVDGDNKHVTWLDRSANGTALSATPVDVAPILQRRLFESGRCVVFTSATLATPEAPLPTLSNPGDDFLAEPPKAQLSRFGYARRRLGAIGIIQPVDELVVDSPFDFRNHALLFVAKDLPEPRDEGFSEQALPVVSELLLAANGGAFVLTTSFRVLKALHERLLAAWDTMPWAGPAPQLLVQGSAPKTQLLQTFKQAGNAVLVATMSFWEGVDVPGDALRLVIIDKIPFSVPTDPLVAARVQHLEESHQNPFNELYIPSAQMALKQGFGRLIRTATDRGVVALLDSRLHRRGYGQRILGALPPAKRTAKLNDAVAFLRAMQSNAP